MSDPKGSRRELGAAMRAVRDHLGITQAAVAPRMGGYSRGYVSHFESGREVPSRIVWSEWLAAIEAAKQTKQRSGEWTATLAELLERAVACHGDALAEAEVARRRRPNPGVPARHGTGSAGSGTDASTGTAIHRDTSGDNSPLEDELTVERRRLLSAFGLVTVAPLLEQAVSSTGGSLRIDDGLIAFVAQATSDYQRAGGQLPPGLLRPPLEAHAGLIQDLLSEGSLLPGQRAKLLEQLSLTASTLTFLHFYDLGDRAGGRSWMRHGLETAEASGAPGASVRALVEASLQLLYSGRGADAIQMLEHARQVAEAKLPSNAVSWALAVEAEAYATIGQRRQCERRLGHAGQRLRSGEAAGEPAWLEHWDRGRLLGYEGACYVRLGLPAEARATLREWRAQTGPNPKRLVVVPADLAITFALEGEIDQACALAEEAVEAASARGFVGTVRERMTRLQPLLEPWKDDPRVRDLGELLRSAGPGTTAVRMV